MICRYLCSSGFEAISLNLLMKYRTSQIIVWFGPWSAELDRCTVLVETCDWWRQSVVTVTHVHWQVSLASTECRVNYTA